MNATGRGRLPCKCVGVALSRFFDLRARENERPNENENEFFRRFIGMSAGAVPLETVAATPRITSMVTMLLCATPARTRSTRPSAVALPLSFE